MELHGIKLDNCELVGFRASVKFFSGNLSKQETINWALEHNTNLKIKRTALLELIHTQEGKELSEPWRTAWRLIEESWREENQSKDSSHEIYQVKDRLNSGELSGTLIYSIVDLVMPRLNIRKLKVHNNQKSRRKKKIFDLLSISLTSEELVDLEILTLNEIDDLTFLVQLGSMLESTLIQKLDMVKRIGWDVDKSFWLLGMPYRVYYAKTAQQDPDKYIQGLAPLIKLLCSVVIRISEINTCSAANFIRRWELISLDIFLRLRAALYTYSDIANREQLSTLLNSVKSKQFWDLTRFPELAELRARKFSYLNNQTQLAILKMIRKYPPRSTWPKEVNDKKVEEYRLCSAITELNRIKAAGNNLPQIDEKFLLSNKTKFPNLGDDDPLEDGFKTATIVREVPINPNKKFDLITGQTRLNLLENTLSSDRKSWNDDPAKNAVDWIRTNSNSLNLLKDFISCDEIEIDYPKVWDNFGWQHKIDLNSNESNIRGDVKEEARNVLRLLSMVSAEVRIQAIRGISHWLYEWKSIIVRLPNTFLIWKLYWPYAVEITNEESEKETDYSFNAVEVDRETKKTQQISSLNTPVAKLLSVYIEACPNLNEVESPFDGESDLSKMREIINNSEGRAGLTGKYRMIEDLSYFLKADYGWTIKYLVEPLKKDTFDALVLWDAVARTSYFKDDLKIIGDVMSEKAKDTRLSRQTRKSLVFSLIVECLHSHLERREPAIHYYRVQQMLRDVDDEIRAQGAKTVQIFISQVSAPINGEPSKFTAEEILEKAVKPFMENVWPQEINLITMGVSRAFSDIPFTTMKSFSAAVKIFERFLIPFKCWSLSDYGFSIRREDEIKVPEIDTEEKAIAFLRLLDLTIGKSEGSIVPYDLSDALDRMNSISAKLSKMQSYKRLKAASRR